MFFLSNIIGFFLKFFLTYLLLPTKYVCLSVCPSVHISVIVTILPKKLHREKYTEKIFVFSSNFFYLCFFLHIRRILTLISLFDSAIFRHLLLVTWQMPLSNPNIWIEHFSHCTYYASQIFCPKYRDPVFGFFHLKCLLVWTKHQGHIVGGKSISRLMC